MDIRIIQDIIEAEKIWKSLSPNGTIYDVWDFRYAFHKNNPQEIFFFTAFESGEPVGLLGLEYNPELRYLEFFGGEFMDSNRCFIKQGYENLIPDLYRSISRKAALFDIVGDDDFTKSLVIEDYNYVLPLEGLENFDGHLERSFSSHRRKNFRRDFRIFEDNNPGLSCVSDENFEALEALFRLNIKRHGKDESYLSSPALRSGLCDLREKFDININSVKINNQRVAVGFGILYKSCFFFLLSGSDNAGFPGSGNYLQKEAFNLAFKLGAKKFDAGLGDCGWKERWHFEKEPQYEWSNF
jgi:CelD/BcsL family acetyltransferase involved in cellulose biosynthesis